MTKQQLTYREYPEFLPELLHLSCTEISGATGHKNPAKMLKKFQMTSGIFKEKN